MAGFSLSTQIAAPVEQVFALFSDFEHAAANVGQIKQTELLTTGSTGVGTRFRETRAFFKREETEELTVTAFEPNHSYTIECTSHGAAYTSVFRFHPSAQGTQVVVEFAMRPLTWLAWLASPLSALLNGTLKKSMQQDLDDLKAVAKAAVAISAE